MAAPGSTLRDKIVIAIDGEKSMLLVDIFSEDKRKIILDNPISYKKWQETIEDILHHIPRETVKAFVFDFVHAKFGTSTEKYKCRLGCRDFLQQLGIYTIFDYKAEGFYLGVLTKRRTMVKEGEIIAVSVAGIEGGGITGDNLFIRKRDCYQLLKLQNSQSDPYSPEWKQEIYAKYGTRCIFYIRVHDMKTLKDFGPYIHAAERLPECRPYIYTIEDGVNFLADAAIYKALHQMGQRINPYHLKFPHGEVFEVCMGSTKVIVCDPEQFLPFEKSVILDSGSETKLRVCFSKFDGGIEELQAIDLPPLMTSKLSITLQITENGFYKLKAKSCDGCYVAEAEGVRDQSECNDTSVCNGLENLKITRETLQSHMFTLLFQKQSYSVLVGGELLKDQDGMEKTPLYISFADEDGDKPTIGEAAKKVFDEKPTFVVFDIIKLASTESADIYSPKWGFKVRNEDDQFLVAMETTNGERVSTIPFLLALFLKSGSDRIKKEFGERIKKVHVKFDGFVPNEILKKNIVEAGNLLAFVDEIVFV